MPVRAFIDDVSLINVTIPASIVANSITLTIVKHCWGTTFCVQDLSGADFVSVRSHLRHFCAACPSRRGKLATATSSTALPLVQTRGPRALTPPDNTFIDRKVSMHTSKQTGIEANGGALLEVEVVNVLTTPFRSKCAAV